MPSSILYTSGSIIPTQNTSITLPVNPSWRDKRFDEPQTIFGKKKEGLNYTYSDRLIGQNGEKHFEAIKTVQGLKVPLESQQYYEKYLSLYFGRDISLDHILVGNNRTTGYSFLVFGYTDKNLIGDKVRETLNRK